MSELAHAKIEVGKLCSITYKNRLHSTRPIGRAQPSCVKPDWRWYLRRNGRGEVVGDVPRLAHAQFVGNNQTNERADSVQRKLQIPWHQTQGGVVGHGLWNELGQKGCSRTCHGWGVSVISGKVCSLACMHVN